MKRRPLLIGFGLALLLGGMGGWWLLQTWQGIPIPATAYGRLRLGMTPSLAEAAVGVPSGDYATQPRIGGILSEFGHVIRETGLPSTALPDAAGRPAPGHPEKLVVERWCWDDYWIWVAFDESGVTVGYYLLKVDDGTGRSSTLFERIRAVLGF
jgi:hypothetical protein